MERWLSLTVSSEEASAASRKPLFLISIPKKIVKLAVRRNRMSLLRKIGGAVMKIADVTKIVVDRSEYRA